VSNSGPLVLFAGGGTGGHLYPGLAIARALVREQPAVRPFFIGAQRGIEREVLPTTEFPHELLPLHPLYRRQPWNNWRTLLGGVQAWRAISRLTQHDHPAAVVGTGGYAAGVALAWARAHGIPTFLHEPDSHPGLTTRVFSRGARGVFLGFPEASTQLTVASHGAVHALGCPIDEPPATSSARAAARAEARAAWGLPEDAFVVLVMGGSQGARAINEAVDQWVARGLPSGMALIWSTGRAQATAYLHRESPMVKVRPYLAPIATAYAAADVALGRAGAMSIAELCAWGLPMLLVPLPTAAQDHQTFNARATAAAGAGVMLRQSDLSVEALSAQFEAWQHDDAARSSMREAALARAKPTAARDIARTLCSLLRLTD
jgi:UDP-N-acetylglucosamine--N-acetylmuramyl-(pentapeptide) pyrophosphoryl-undecaprenol N-acetylglucosamine transferase